VQGFNAIAVMEPVFDRNHQFVGSLSVLLDFEKLARDYVRPLHDASHYRYLHVQRQRPDFDLQPAAAQRRRITNIYDVARKFPSLLAFAKQMIAADLRWKRRREGSICVQLEPGQPD